MLYIDGEMGAAALRERLALFGPPPATLAVFPADLDKGPLLDLARPESQLRMIELQERQRELDEAGEP